MRLEFLIRPCRTPIRLQRPQTRQLKSALPRLSFSCTDMIFRDIVRAMTTLAVSLRTGTLMVCPVFVRRPAETVLVVARICITSNPEQQLVLKNGLLKIPSTNRCITYVSLGSRGVRFYPCDASNRNQIWQPVGNSFRLVSSPAICIAGLPYVF